MSTLFNIEPSKSAVLSPDGLYRYTLTRELSDDPRTVNFVMLNPSRADHEVDDPTATRCIGYARRWGFGRLVLTNLFALRSTDPKALRSASDRIGPDNDRHLVEQARGASLVVCAWGNDGALGERWRRVVKLLTEAGVTLHALKLTGQGRPSHPLYLPGDAVPFEWRPR